MPASFFLQSSNKFFLSLSFLFLLFSFFFSRVTHDIYRLDTRHLIRRIIDAISGDVTPVCFPRRVNSRRVESARQTLFISLVCVHCRRRAGVNRGVNKTVGFERGFYQVRALYEIPWRYFISFYFSFFFFGRIFHENNTIFRIHRSLDKL